MMEVFALRLAQVMVGILAGVLFLMVLAIAGGAILVLAKISPLLAIFAALVIFMAGVIGWSA